MKVDIPEWVRYVAMDKNGIWYGFEGEPVLFNHPKFVAWDYDDLDEMKHAKIVFIGDSSQITPKFDDHTILFTKAEFLEKFQFTSS